MLKRIGMMASLLNNASEINIHKWYYCFVKLT